MKLLAILLTTLFVGLQLTGYIAWSWWLVLSPVLVWLVAVFLFFFLAFKAMNK